jgi:2-oxoisovalerate dehydrogenase E1 component beta subunit
MERDSRARRPNVVVFGQDVGLLSAACSLHEGLQAKYGTSRVFDAPISEGGIVGAAVGMGAYGLRPVVEIQFADYFYPASDQIVSEAARLRYRSAGDFTAPITIRMPCGGGIYGGQTHSQSPEALFTHVCGLRTVMPSNPYDAKGLLIASIENDDPVIFLEPKRLYNGPFDGHHDRPSCRGQAPLGDVPEGYYTGAARPRRAVFRPAATLTVLTYGTMVFVAEAAAQETGIDAEIIDLRTLWPLDLETIVASVKKTGRCIVVHEATRTSGFGAELVSLVQEHCFYHLEVPVERVTGWDTPYPHSLEWAYFPAPTASARRCAGRWRRLMGVRVIKMPDIGEGIAEVELVAWHVKPGDAVVEDQPLADVMTDKATVEIPSPVHGKVVALAARSGRRWPSVGADPHRECAARRRARRRRVPLAGDPAAPRRARRLPRRPVRACAAPAPRPPRGARRLAAPRRPHRRARRAGDDRRRRPRCGRA